MQVASRLNAGHFNKLQQVFTRQFATSLILAHSLQLDVINKLVDKLQQAGKIDNLQQVCDILGC